MMKETSGIHRLPFVGLCVPGGVAIGVTGLSAEEVGRPKSDRPAMDPTEGGGLVFTKADRAQELPRRRLGWM